MNFWKRLLAPLRPHPMGTAVVETPTQLKSVEASTTAVLASATEGSENFEAPGQSGTTSTKSPAPVDPSIQTEAPTQDETALPGEVRRYFEESIAPYADRDLEVAPTLTGSAFTLSDVSEARAEFERAVAEQDAKEVAELAAAGKDAPKDDDADGTIALSLGFGPGQDDLARNHLIECVANKKIEPIQARQLAVKVAEMEGEGLDPSVILERTRAEVKAAIRRMESPEKAAARAAHHAAVEQSKIFAARVRAQKEAREAAKRAEKDEEAEKDTEKDKGPTRGM